MLIADDAISFFVDYNSVIGIKGNMRFRFSKVIYDKGALLKAAYAYTDRAYIHIDVDEDHYIVDVNMKDNVEDSDIKLEAFQNEILAQMVRQDINSKTKRTRELILAREIASTMISEVPSYQPEEGTVDIDDILTDWFEKYE